MSRESVSRDRSSHYSYTSDGPITVSYFGIRPESTNQLDFLYSVPILIRSRMIFDKLGCYCSKVHTCTLSLSNPRPQYRRSRVRIWRRSQNTKVSSDNILIFRYYLSLSRSVTPLTGWTVSIDTSRQRPARRTPPACKPPYVCHESDSGRCRK